MYKWLAVLLLMSVSVMSVLYLRSENKRLEADISKAVEANDSYVKAVKDLKRQQKKAEKALNKRLKLQHTQEIKLNALKKALRDSRKKATKEQLKCLKSDVPDYIVNLLRTVDRKEGGSSKGKSREGLPFSIHLLKNPYP